MIVARPPPPQVLDSVAIVGAGFTGTLLAINLLRHDRLQVTLIERAEAAGRGLAFGAAHPMHLLNVRAGNMSAFPDDTDHFVRWLRAVMPEVGADGFVPRLVYGRYLEELLDAAVARGGDRLRIVRGEVIAIAPDADGARLTLADGRSLTADAAVLAVGNLAPGTPRGIDPDALGTDLYRGDPWQQGIADGLANGDAVMVLGTGLTMVDVVLKLVAEDIHGPIVALSRHGLLPHVHAPTRPAPPFDRRSPGALSRLVREVRAGCDAGDWRAGVDRLRPATQALWRAADDGARARFLRHLRPWWDIHRHRIAPKVAERIAGLRASGQLTIAAGRVEAIARADGGARVRWRPRDGGSTQLVVRRVINCTGPQGDLTRTADPLLAALYRAGTIRGDALRLGVDVDAQMRTIDASGRANHRLLAVGPITRGAFWEIVAVPDIRAQTWSLARRMTNTHWVEGEGL